jgi:hypothetical protein
VFLLRDHLGHSQLPVVGEGLSGVLQKVGTLAGLRRRHGRRQVHEPARVHGEPAHDLERRRGVLLPDGYVPLQTDGDDAFAGHVPDVEEVVVGALLLYRRRRGVGRQEGSRGPVVGVLRWDGYQL